MAFRVANIRRNPLRSSLALVVLDLLDLLAASQLGCQRTLRWNPSLSLLWLLVDGAYEFWAVPSTLPDLNWLRVVSRFVYRRGGQAASFAFCSISDS